MRGDGTYKHVTATSGAPKGEESMRAWKELLHLLAASGGCRRADLRRGRWQSDPNMYEVMHYAAATGVL